MEHSRQYEEATELNMDEYKKIRGHKKRMKEVVKMGNELNLPKCPWTIYKIERQVSLCAWVQGPPWKKHK